jgi:hypothetical protein
MKSMLRYSAATLLAGVMFVSATTAQAQSTTLAALLAGGSITSGNLVFSSFQNATQMGDLNVNYADIMVTPLLSGGNYGLRFQSAEWSLTGINLSYDLAFDFRVTTADASPTMSANTLGIIGGTSGPGHAQIAETVVDLSNHSLAGELVYLNQIGTGNNQFMDSSAFSGASQSEVVAHKDFAMTTTGSDPSAQVFVSHFDQTFTVTEVPEPSTLALGLVGGLASLLALRRRN